MHVWFRERWRRFREWLRKELASHLEPRRIFWALFLGVFIGTTPLWGLHVVLCVFAARALKLNQALMLFAVGVSNPVMGPPLLALDAAVGSAVLGRGFVLPTIDFSGDLRPILALGGQIVVDLFVGSFVVGPLLGALCGGLGVLLAHRWRPTEAPRP
ncbi:hypothetical protein LBMAG42_19560 [Deltaproteobacteria bacterium]|nr:hypothetical protein LBMAG42_19560 [Deltaproteobacteria bacterium]